MSRQAATLATTPQRILLIRPSALGDVCRSVPLLTSVRAAFPDAAIDWVVQDSFVAAIEAHPALTQPITFPRQRFGHWYRRPTVGWETAAWFNNLRRRRYDVVIDAQGLSRSGLMAAATRAPLRIGPRGAREIAAIGYNCRVNVARHVHTVDQMLALLEPLNVPIVRDMRLYTTEAARTWWNQHRHAEAIPDHYAVLAPTARWASKRWPVDRWRDLLTPIAAHGFAAAVIIGAPGEEDQVQQLTNTPSSALPLFNIVGRASIPQTMAVIAASGLVIANDSAPLHMAVGFQRPCLGLFGPTDAAVVGPYRLPGAVVQAPAEPHEIIHYRDRDLGDRVMQRITTARVEAALTRLFHAD